VCGHGQRPLYSINVHNIRSMKAVQLIISILHSPLPVPTRPLCFHRRDTAIDRRRGEPRDHGPVMERAFRRDTRLLLGWWQALLLAWWPAAACYCAHGKGWCASVTCCGLWLGAGCCFLVAGREGLTAAWESKQRPGLLRPTEYTVLALLF
jgi:hypothetical protein